MNYENKGKKVLKVGGWVIAGLAIATITAFLFGFIVMLLWNWLMPAIFGLVEITYIQAWGLVLLSHILFKSGHSRPGRPFGRFGKRGGQGRSFGRGREGNRDEWKRDFFSRMHEHDSHKDDIEENKESD